MKLKLVLVLPLLGLAACGSEPARENAPSEAAEAPVTAGSAQVVGDVPMESSAENAAAALPPLPPAEGLTLAEQADFEAGLPPVQTGPMAVQASPVWQDAELAGERQMQLTLPPADHPMWHVLRKTRVWLDEPTQMFRASHPAEVRRLAGTRMTIRGYMLPLEADMRTTHFLISPYTPVCFFHPPAEPNEVVEVRLSRPIDAGYHLVEVTGIFQLADDGEKGLFFVIDRGSARIVERVDG